MRGCIGCVWMLRRAITCVNTADAWHQCALLGGSIIANDLADMTQGAFDISTRFAKAMNHGKSTCEYRADVPRAFDAD